ncbi:Ig-like domain-containing protein [Anaerobacterium chartisolvens]|uniref:Ig-like domain-containing protein n=1 Tax=Anaerobacterium chartisolvens TaxID=1297424 RepID=UPI0011C049E1|nr:Ig-like domain-containing protein [Anaerobacterium chartisolvens]
MGNKFTGSKVLIKYLSILLAVVMAFGLVPGQMQGPWQVSAADTIVVGWDFNDGNQIADAGVSSNASQVISREDSYSGTYSYTAGAAGTPDTALSSNAWSEGAGTKYLKISFSTSGYFDLTLESKLRSSGTGPRDFKLQYSADGTEWNDISGGAVVSGNGSFESNSIVLPEAVEDQSIVYIRWLLDSNVSAAGTGDMSGSNGTCRIDDIVISSSGDSPGGPEDTAPPAVLSKSPADGAAGVAWNAVISVLFDENIVAGSEISSISIKDEDSTPVAGVSNVISGAALTIAHEQLEKDKTYTVTIPAGAVQDSSENATDYDIIWSFTTALDEVITPINEIDTVDSNGLPTKTQELYTIEGVVTSAPGGLGSGKKMFVQDESGGICVYHSTQSISGVAEGDIVRVTGKVIQYNGLTELDPSVAGGAVQVISSGNALPAPVELSSLSELRSFVTAEPYEGKLVRVRVKVSSAVASNGNGAITDVDGSNSITLRIETATGIAASSLIPGQELVITGIVAQYDSSSPYTSGYQLTPRYPSDISDAPDDKAPVAQQTEPSNGKTNVLINAPLSVEFDEEIVAGAAIASITVIDDQSYSVGGISSSTSGNMLYIDHADFAYGRTYTVTIPAGAVEDSQGNATSAPTVWSFSTRASADLDGPVALSKTPAEDATGVSKNASVSVMFGEDIRQGSASSGISIKDSLGNPVSGVDCKIEDSVLTLTHAVFGYSTEYTVSIPAGAVEDFSGNGTGSEIVWSFTTGQEEVYSLYYGQLHSHTNFSDGQGSPDDAYSWARDEGHADFFAVTDHSNWFDNEKNTANESITSISESTSQEWKDLNSIADSYNNDGSFTAIAGFEMTWSNGTGHINTFNTPWFVSRSNSAMDLNAYYNKIKESPDSINQLNHPGKTFGDFFDFGYYSKEADAVVQLIEVGNGEGPIRGSGYFPSYEYYTRALDKGWHVAPSNNQDNHKQKWVTANEARTVALATELTRDGIYDAIRERRVYATEDRNLQIEYELNGNVMGSILGDTDDSLSFEIKVTDPDAGDSIGKISIISNGGTVAASKTFSGNNAEWSFELEPKYSYYYVRVDQTDKDIAVTAPVWVGETDKAGISTSAGTGLSVKGEEVTITSTIYNNEASPMQVASLEYSIDGNAINTAPAINPVAPSSTALYSFGYNPVQVGDVSINVKLTASINGTQRVYTDVLKLNVSDPSVITKIIIDGSHYNDYVAGNYANNMGNITELSTGRGVQVIVQKQPLTDEVLSDVQLLLLTPPAKKSGTSNGVSYTAKPYTQDEINVIKRFADRGGNIVVAGLADYQDNGAAAQNHTAYQQNLVLQAIGAGSRINDDEVVDYQNNPNVNPPGVAGGTPFRVPMNTYNMSSPYLNGVVPEQDYSFYSGCSFTMGNNAKWLVKGHSTTYGFDSDNDGLGGSYVAAANAAIPSPDGGIGKGNVVALAEETLPGGGKLFIGGTVFFSNFEIKASLDNYGQLQNSNYNITMNIIDSIKKAVPVTPIKQIRAAQAGETFCAEGIVTAGTQQGNAFFDTIYIQDATGGINIFPVSDMNIRVGQKVKVLGYVGQYQGDIELVMQQIEVTDAAQKPVAAKEFPTGDSMLPKNGGWLAKVCGTVTGITENTIFIDDGTGEARIFIDGYIGDSTGRINQPGKWEPSIKVGDTVSAIGLASVDTEGSRLRVRDTSEIIKVKKTYKVLYDSNGGTSGSVPQDNTGYLPRDTVNVLSNSGSLAKTGYSFKGWNTKSDGTGIDYTAGAGKLIITSDIILYAKWEKVSDATPSPTGNSGKTGTTTTTKASIEPKLGEGGEVSIELKSKLDKSTGEARAQLDSDTLAKALEIAREDEEGIKTVKLQVSGAEGSTSYIQELPTKALIESKSTQRLSISTDVAEVSIPGNMLSAAGTGETDKVALKVGLVNKDELSSELREKVGNAPVIELGISVNGKTVKWQNEDAPVLITIPYTPTEEELKNPDHIVIIYIDGEGMPHSVPNGRYDSKTKTISFTTTHFSRYAVAYIYKTFDDIQKYPHAKASIEVIASKGIIDGKSELEFDPDKEITRAELIQMLVKALGLTTSFTESFSDVDPSHRYYKELGIAKKIGLAKGGGENRFSPDKRVTRQDMMVFCYRALVLSKKLNPGLSEAQLDRFSDRSRIASYAIEAASAMVKEGIIGGSGQKINPLANATKAEAAMVMYRILKK